MWHAHIIDTEKYAADCQSAFGYFVHHIPSRKEESPVERSRLAAAFNQTASLFREVVGFNFVVSATGTQDADQMAICQGKSCSGPTPDCFAGSPLKTQGNPADSFDQMAICQGKSCSGPTPNCFAGSPVKTTENTAPECIISGPACIARCTDEITLTSTDVGQRRVTAALQPG